MDKTVAKINKRLNGKRNRKKQSLFRFKVSKAEEWLSDSSDEDYAADVSPNSSRKHEAKRKHGESKTRKIKIDRSKLI